MRQDFGLSKRQRNLYLKNPAKHWLKHYQDMSDH